MDPIVGDRVTLRLFREDELELWWEASQALGADTFPAGPPTRAALLARIHRGGRLPNGELDLAIEVDGRVVGDIQTQRPGPLPPGVHQIGIALFRAEDRGKGYGGDALRLFVDWLFRERSADRVQGGTAPHNAAMRRVFERLGFTEREAILVFGQRHLLYAIDRDVWSASS